jgi:thiamine-phosphate pyrophosphorylase
MAIAGRLNREGGVATQIPPLFLLTDPVRTPDPLSLARRLPPGAAIIFRHFGAADRVRTARRLARLARARQLSLLISADPELALYVNAAGVHWPEARLPQMRDPRLRLETASAHGASGLTAAARFGAAACLLGPIFPTRSAAKNVPLGLFRASQLARAATLPVVALGGIDAGNASVLAARGFAGIAAIDAFREIPK